MWTFGIGIRNVFMLSREILARYVSIIDDSIITERDTCTFPSRSGEDRHITGISLHNDYVHFLSWKRLIRYCFREARNNDCLRKHPQAEIFLELNNSTDKGLLYVVTVKALVSRIRFIGQITRNNLRIAYHKLYSIIRPNWDQSICLSVD